MEIILKKDVEGVGFKDDIITVKNGFGRNFLIPNGSAILATSSAKKILTENLKQQAVKDKKLVDDANKIAKKIKALDIKIKSKVGKDKKLFGSVNNINVQNELKEKGVEIDKRAIMITGNLIKQLGKYKKSRNILSAIDNTFATGLIVFNCTEGAKIDEMINKLISSNTPQTITLSSTGINQNNVTVSKFTFEWSLKIREK